MCEQSELIDASYQDCSFIPSTQLQELRALVEELREFRNSILSLSEIQNGGSISLTVLHMTNDRRWVVFRRVDNRKDRLSGYHSTPDAAIKEALGR